MVLCHVGDTEFEYISYLAGTAQCVLKEWVGGGLQVQAVNIPFRAVTTGQVREKLYKLLLL